MSWISHTLLPQIPRGIRNRVIPGNDAIIQREIDTAIEELRIHSDVVTVFSSLMARLGVHWRTSSANDEKNTHVEEKRLRTEYANNIRLIPVQTAGANEIAKVTSVRIREPLLGEGEKVGVIVPGFAQILDTIDPLTLALGMEGADQFTKIIVLALPEIPHGDTPSQHLDRDATLLVRALQQFDQTVLSSSEVTVIGFSEGAGITEHVATNLKTLGVPRVRAIFLSSTGLGQIASGNPFRFGLRVLLEGGRIALGLLNIRPDPEMNELFRGITLRQKLINTVYLGELLYRIVARINVPMLVSDLFFHRDTPRVQQMRQIAEANPTHGEDTGIERYFVLQSVDEIFPFSQIIPWIQNELLKRGESTEGTYIELIARYTRTDPSRVQIIGREGSYSVHHGLPVTAGSVIAGKILDVLRVP